jgi:transcriptional regulator with XRE-family HTH domain
MSQEGLADLVGVTFQQVQKYERGINRITASRLLDIAIALDTPVASFFEGLSGSRRGKPAQDVDMLLATPGATDLLRNFAAINSEKTRRQVFDLVKTMAGVT